MNIPTQAKTGLEWATPSLALTALAAELYNIFAFHLTLASATIAPALVASVVWVLVFLQYRKSFTGIFTAKPATQARIASCPPLARQGGGPLKPAFGLSGGVRSWA